MFRGNFQFGRFFKHLKKRVLERVTSPEGKAEMFGHVRDVTLGVAGVYTVFNFVFNVTWCTGPSMEPTLATEGSFVIVDIFSHSILKKPLAMGDVVIALSPSDHTRSKHALVQC